ncbi:MAG: peptide chain release factor N(5)-glutamine methyltransferase [Actinomycetota bacterium]|nr:peptide chain release factor N(5)-glutamine methyltransferase [Actinomycetota bacterium]
MSSYRHTLARVEDRLRRAGAESPEFDAKWILEAATGRDHGELLLAPEISSHEERACDDLTARRAGGEPLQYVTEVAGFRRLEISVGPGVFIPRPETELVAEQAMHRLPHGGRVVDAGTGSGAIALAIADERPDAVVFATEASPRAFSWAEMNRDHLRKEVNLVMCDLLTGLPQALLGSLDVVVSNPPYIDRSEWSTMAREVIEHEPHDALFADERGLGVILELARSAQRWLKPLGWLVLEIGDGQADEVRTRLAASGYECVSIGRDLNGKDRIAEGRKERR